MIESLAELQGYAFVAVVTGGILITVFLLFIMYANRYVKVGPNEALIVSGLGKTETDQTGRTIKRGFKVVRGGGIFVFPGLQRRRSSRLKS